MIKGSWYRRPWLLLYLLLLCLLHSRSNLTRLRYPGYPGRSRWYPRSLGLYHTTRSNSRSKSHTMWSWWPCRPNLHLMWSRWCSWGSRRSRWSRSGTPRNSWHTLRGLLHELRLARLTRMELALLLLKHGSLVTPRHHRLLNIYHLESLRSWLLRLLDLRLGHCDPRGSAYHRSSLTWYLRNGGLRHYRLLLLLGRWQRSSKNLLRTPLLSHGLRRHCPIAEHIL
jgi:hypothetical protein